MSAIQREMSSAASHRCFSLSQRTVGFCCQIEKILFSSSGNYTVGDNETSISFKMNKSSFSSTCCLTRSFLHTLLLLFCFVQLYYRELISFTVHVVGDSRIENLREAAVHRSLMEARKLTRRTFCKTKRAQNTFPFAPWCL